MNEGMFGTYLIYHLKGIFSPLGVLSYTHCVQISDFRIWNKGTIKLSIEYSYIPSDEYGT